MMSRTLLLGLLLECLAFGAIGHGLLGLGRSGTFAFAVAAILLARVVVIGVTWWMAWRHASPAPRLSAGRTLVMLVGEYLAFVLAFVIVQPFARLWMPTDRLRPGTAPVLLVHGYGCNRACWWWLRRRLEAAGHAVATLSLEPPWGGIEGFAGQLQARIEAVCAATGADRVTLVAHSMGGLVSRRFLADHGAARVARLITIGSPHHGTELARLGLGRCAAQMRPGSRFLTALQAEPVGVPFVSIRTPQDNFVMPQDSQRHPEAVDEPLPGVGHLASLVHPQTLAIVLRHVGRSPG